MHDDSLSQRKCCFCDYQCVELAKTFAMSFGGLSFIESPAEGLPMVENVYSHLLECVHGSLFRQVGTNSGFSSLIVNTAALIMSSCVTSVL